MSNFASKILDYMEFQFEKLAVWQQAKELVKIVYKLVAKFPQEERYALCDQLRRAIVSVPSNIAEGSGRTHQNDKIHFLEIAYGSLMEAYCQLSVAFELGYITEDDFKPLKPLFYTEAKMLSGLRKSYEAQ